MPRLIAIDLGAHAVKVTTYRRDGRKFSFEDRHRVAVPQDGAAPTLEARLVALDTILDDHPELRASSGDTFGLAFPGEYATFHRVHMPFADKAQIEKTLPFTVESEVPFDLEEMVLGWRVLRSTDKTEVLAALVRHETVARWIAGLAERRVDPAVVHIDSELLGHYGQNPPESENLLKSPAVAVLDIGHMHTLVSVVVGGGVAFARAINVGGQAFTRAIQGALGCSWAEAEARKHGLFVDHPGGEGVQDEVTDPGDDVKGPKGSGYAALPANARAAMDGAIGQLLAELRSTLIKAEDSLGVSVEEVRVTGGSARITELWDYLAADLGVPVRRCGDPEGDAVPVSFQQSHALAMQMMGSTKSPAIDLRLGDLEYRGGADLVRTTLVYGGSALAFFMMAALVMFAIQYRSLSVEQSTAEERIREILTTNFPEIPPGTVSDPENAVVLAAGFRDDAVQRAEILSRGTTGVPPTIDAIAALTDAFPDHPTVKVEVEQLTITPAQISFDAETDGYAASAQVEEELQNQDRFMGATKGQETKLSNGHVKFPITIPLADDLEEEG